MGENAPLKDCVIFFSVKQKLNVLRKVSDNYINYKPSMKNVQTFHVIRFLTKNLFVPRGRFTHLWGKTPPSLTKQFALNIYSKIRVQAVLAFKKKREYNQ